MGTPDVPSSGWLNRPTLLKSNVASKPPSELLSVRTGCVKAPVSTGHSLKLRPDPLGTHPSAPNYFDTSCLQEENNNDWGKAL